MSCFSTQLKVVLERARMSRDQLAQATGLSYSLLTNMANDRREPDGVILEALAQALPAEAMADLLIAHWCDICPEKLRRLVHLIPAEKSEVLEETVAPYGVSKADMDLEDAVERVKRAAIKHPEWRAAVFALSKTIAD